MPTWYLLFLLNPIANDPATVTGAMPFANQRLCETTRQLIWSISGKIKPECQLVSPAILIQQGFTIMDSAENPPGLVKKQ